MQAANCFATFNSIQMNERSASSLVATNNNNNNERANLMMLQAKCAASLNHDATGPSIMRLVAIRHLPLASRNLNQTVLICRCIFARKKKV